MPNQLATEFLIMALYLALVVVCYGLLSRIFRRVLDPTFDLPDIPLPASVRWLIFFIAITIPAALAAGLHALFGFTMWMMS